MAALKIDGIYLIKEPRRYYPNRELAAAVLDQDYPLVVVVHDEAECQQPAMAHRVREAAERQADGQALLAPDSPLRILAQQQVRHEAAHELVGEDDAHRLAAVRIGQRLRSVLSRALRGHSS